MSFTFVHATDLHYESGDEPDIPEANRRIRCLVDDLNRLSGDERPAFVILSGDLSQRGAADAADLVGAKAELDRLDAPCWVVAGNHDLAPHRGFAARYPGKEDYFEGPAEGSSFAAVFGERALRFSFEQQRLRFVGITLRDEDPDGALDWLDRETLRAPADPGERTIVVCHYGLFTPRDSGPLSTWGFARIGAVLPRLRSIVTRPESRCLLYLQGHNHINSVRAYDRMWQIAGGGIQRGCTGFRIFRVGEEKITAEFRLLSNPELWSFDYFSAAHPDTCVDPTHHSAEEYHLGNAEERTNTFAW